MRYVREHTAKVLNETYGIDPEVTSELFDLGLLSEQACRNMLIKKEFRLKGIWGNKERLKIALSEKYFVSVKLVEKVISL